MELTPENKAHIDAMSYVDLLRCWRFAPPGDPWFQGATGIYWKIRLHELRTNGADHVAASKSIGWDQ